MNKIKVVIIGAGQIVSGYDSIIDLSILTHCHAIKKLNEFELIGVYDINDEALENVSKKWQVKIFNDFELMMKTLPDVVVIAVNNTHHEYYLEKLLSYDVKLVLCEKPLTTDNKSGKKIIELYKNSCTNLAVCYQRRYDDDINLIKSKYQSGDLGKLINGVVIYSKGILHNGSHAVDILRYIFGEVKNISSFDYKIDYSDEDPTVSAFLQFNDAKVTLVSSDESFYSLFEIDLIFEKGRFRLYDSGFKIDIFNVIQDPFFKGYYSLNLLDSRSSSLHYALLNLWKGVHDFFSNKTPLKSTGEDALNTQTTCLTIKQLIKK
jgi:predicted dehydrogenase